MRFHKLLLPVAVLFLIYPNHVAAQQKPSAAIGALFKAAEQGDVALSHFVSKRLQVFFTVDRNLRTAHLQVNSTIKRSFMSRAMNSWMSEIASPSSTSNVARSSSRSSAMFL